MARALVVLMLALASGCAHYVGGAKPIEESRVDDGWIRAAPTPTVHQRNLADCGAAALAMVAGRWQLALTLEDAARALPPPGRVGVRLKDLREAATSKGLEAYAIAADQSVLRHELAAGRPVIGAAVPGLIEAVRPDQTGLLVAEDSDEELTAALTTAAARPALCDAWGDAARRWVQPYDWRQIARRHLQLYATLLETGRQCSVPERVLPIRRVA